MINGLINFLIVYTVGVLVAYMLNKWIYKHDKEFIDEESAPFTGEFMMKATSFASWIMVIMIVLDMIVHVFKRNNEQN